uniref:Putative secreted salivary protein n=1 Tax=Ixodes ricinus TaxID=34613 RepID=A0A090X7V9_IXORI
MMAKALFYLFFGLFGDVMCNNIDPRICTTDSYQAEGYAPSCTFKCLNNGVEEEVNYATGTFCFVNRKDGDTAPPWGTAKMACAYQKTEDPRKGSTNPNQVRE